MKKIVSFALVLSFMFFTIPAQAAEIGTPVISNRAETIAEGSVRAEEVEWHYREYNGKRQMRLWSVTQSKWLTDWIDC